MDLPIPHGAVAALAAFVRQRLTEAGDALAPLWSRRGSTDVQVHASARQLAMVIVTASAPFAPTPQARARLLRQMHATGLLSEREADRTARVLLAGDHDGDALGVAG